MLPLLAVALLGGFFLMQLPILWSAVRVARARGFAWRQIGGALMRQPEWWVCFWYPRRFRRAGDVWDRLPPPIRAWRIIVTALLADFVLVIYVVMVLVRLHFGRDLLLVHIFGEPAIRARQAIDDLAKGTLFPLLLVAAFFVLSAALAVAAFFSARFMRRQAFDTFTLRRVSRTLIIGPTSKRSPWKKPEVAQVLLPAPAGQRVEPRTAREVLASLSEVLRGLPVEARAVAEDAAAAARALVQAIDSHDAVVARLTRNADPAEGARLRERLAALRDANDPETSPMAELLERQLALLDEMTARIATVRTARDRLLAALKALWRAVNELALTPADAEAARRVRAMSADARVVLAGPEAFASEGPTGTQPQ
jgi:hypothetical protein